MQKDLKQFEEILSLRRILNILFCCKTQKYEPLHNYQDEVSRQIDVPLQKDAFYTNSIQKDFPMQKNFHFHNPMQINSLTEPNLPSISVRD
jgi:hypothetical protein